MLKIWIDAGHGGVQPGICYGGRIEKAYTLPTAIALQNELERCGFTVKQTRTTDVDVTVGQRARNANAWGADYFVSIHLNGSVGHNAMGAETWHSITGGQSKALAQAIQKEVAALGYKDRALKSEANEKGKDSLCVIRETNAPAVLVEVGFLDWDADMRIFDAAKAAQAIARGICNHTGVAYKPATAAATAPATIRADTSGTITVKKGEYYQMRTYSPTGARVVSGNPDSVVVVSRNVTRGADGAEDWYLVPIGDRGSQTGIYLSAAGDKNGKQCCIVKIG
ncbi:N-acetylmuramoyl-L-alanine amidase [Faecalispora jeddahensis]|uniref:N-acetylmuramoyl-L-alanine amidase family protein n=1 Tax=Faecalispora jeddahensis TaxID=1414721 RepID=UPI001899DA71|nr:N-acetylmuramoyl-L-alanine amidase [Faecalispora jeddahensis]